VKYASVPSWLEARVEQIPRIQDDIQQIVAQIEEEARGGGLLGSSQSLTELMTILLQKRQTMLCELATVPVPLPSEEVDQVKTLLAELEAEIAALESLNGRQALGILLAEGARLAENSRADRDGRLDTADHVFRERGDDVIALSDVSDRDARSVGVPSARPQDEFVACARHFFQRLVPRHAALRPAPCLPNPLNA
jgi:hypothetical protein